MHSSSDLPWWKRGVCYQIYPRSFLDGNDDGVGDLYGILQKLDYLNDGTEQSLGVDALWLSPIHPSPQKDFGYDIVNYCDIDRSFGDLEVFGELVDQAHSRGLKIILDLVVNHTSDRHPWFIDARSSRFHPKRDWYLWRDPVAGKPPNNWASVFGGSGWRWDPTTEQYYFHSFLTEQPDLNWRNAEVRSAIYDTMQLWLDRGVDGFRLDVYNCYLKDEALRSNPHRWSLLGLFHKFYRQHHIYDRDRPGLMDILKEMRSVVDAYPERMLVGETLDETLQYDRAAASYGAEGDALNLVFNFQWMHSRWGPKSFGRAIRSWHEEASSSGWPSWVMSNHDFPRQFSRYDHKGSGSARAKLLAIMLLTLRGSPFLYYGEEIGMAEGRLPRHRLQDPVGRKFWPVHRGRDGCRTPMQWTAEEHAGFSSVSPWLPVNPDFRTKNVASQAADPNSILSTYRSLIWLRRSHPALQAGALVFPQTDHPCVLSWLRIHDTERIRVVLNLSASEVHLPSPDLEPYASLFTTHALPAREDEETAKPLILRPYEGRVLLVGTTGMNHRPQ